MYSNYGTTHPLILLYLLCLAVCPEVLINVDYVHRSRVFVIRYSCAIIGRRFLGTVIMIIVGKMSLYGGDECEKHTQK